MPPELNLDKFQEQFHWAKDHLSLRNEAHHRATLSCEAPAITWPVGFAPERHKDPQDAMNADAFNHRLKNWIEARVQVLVERLLALGQPSGARHPKSFWIDENNSSPEINIWTAKPKAEEFSVLWRGIKVQTRMEIHPDYAAATFIVSLGDQNDQERHEAEEPEEKGLIFRTRSFSTFARPYRTRATPKRRWPRKHRSFSSAKPGVDSPEMCSMPTHSPVMKLSFLVRYS